MANEQGGEGAVIESGKTPPYVAFSTFQTSLERLSAGGVPNQIDRSIWGSFSGAVQGQLIIAYRYLGLIDAFDNPTDALHRFVDASGEGQKAQLAIILKRSYPSLFALDLKRATPKQVSEGIAGLGVSGETAKKARSFFIKAAQFAGVEVSSLLTERQRKPVSANGGTRRTTSPKPRIPKGRAKSQIPQTPSAPAGGQSQTVELKTGGSLTLTLSVNLLEMKGADREFVLGLIDKIQEYEGSKETE